MADPSKSASSFSFGQPATSGGTSGLFGQIASSAPKQGGGLFGTSANPTTTSAAKPFGNTTVFSGGGDSNLFGGASKPSTGFNIGPAQSNKTPGGLFGSGQLGSQNQPSTSASSSTAFSALSTPEKSSEQLSSGQTQTSNLFGGGSGGGSTTSAFSFGNLGSTPSQTTSTTPTSKPAVTLFDNSTTPAGPPPSNNSTAGSGSALFGRPRQDASNPFSNLGTSSSTQKGTATAAQASPFGGFIVEASKPQETPAMTSATQTPSLFGSTANDAGKSNSFGGSKRAAQPEGGFFGNPNKTKDTGVNKPGISQQPQSEAPKSSLFNLGGQQPTNTSAAPSTSASLFGNAGSPKAFSFAEATQFQSPQSNTVTPSTVASAGSDLFRRPTSSATSAPSTSAPAGGMFSNLGNSQDKAPTSAAGTSSSSSAPGPTSSLFAPKPADPISTSQAPSHAATTGTAYGTEAAPANLGASTAGPAPPAQSRLKNKSMDDIITRWASDLSKYQKEFHQQAEKVAAWDQMLVVNSEKIQKLYGSTLEAERATTEVERQLTAVENDQAELSMWLDHYEKEVDTMISNSVGQRDTLSGPDQERERTYQLASKLQERLDEMGKDLSSMIEEINDASSTLNKNKDADDPLSQVVRVLNSHLTQLQQIDQGAAALQQKVKEAQRASQSIGPLNSLSGPSSDAADGFYRSFMGRR
ncbi:hypothetical protein N7G274_005251 [Stereocaulon virgatum]|uniref:Nucleoporin NSP1-like C-terminal domain-containing protein n=1 Tax=Stereocaulon virgatum TaxID=373712 RepID=A0ABR4AAG8_9LECA